VVPPGDDVLFSRNQQKVTAQDFQLLKVIGKGSFGKVMQVKKKDDGKIYAMKVLSKQAIISRNQVTHTKSEKNILQVIQHPFIVGLHFAFQTPGKLYMILDYINGGELFYHLKREGRFPESRVKFYAAEITTALCHLHALDIVYRDLKPENILIDQHGHIVITDFGLSKQIIESSGTHTFCGTPEYLAPEVLRGQGHGTPVDWWSLGTLVFEMLTGLPPFYSSNTNVMYQKILTGDLRIPTEVAISAEGKSFIAQLLERDPAARLGGEAVKSHPWFTGYDWEALLDKRITPPWIPPVIDSTDTTQIDPAFTAEIPRDTPPDPSNLPGNDSTFVGFSYARPSDMKK
jgi:serine/threonine protein kinase